ncbi:MAG: hypothetical protein LQ345_007367 [Seirophora villosa]|nr:MAG: hypothetical protein LQ345_007367 [Seirophora villosa]
MICLELHEKYGPVVRTGPDMVLVNDPDSLSIIFRWDRGGGLDAFFKLSKISNLLADAEMKGHDKMKRAFKQPVNWVFQLSLPSILEHEAAIDDLIQTLFKKLRAEHGHGEICDLSAWIDLLPPDVVSALLWSKPLGLIKKGCDFEKMVYGIERAVDDAAERKSGKVRQDIVQSLVDYRDHDGKPIPKERLYGDVYGLIVAGSGTTSAILKMAVVFVATHPSALKRLVQEIDEAEEAGLLSPVLQFKVAADQQALYMETKHFPYLTAILIETLRL